MNGWESVWDSSLATVLDGPFMLDLWAERMFLATWQGGLCLLFAWLICRLVSDLSPTVRNWIWRIAFAEFMILVFVGGIVELPVFSSADAPPQPVAHSPLGAKSSPALPGLPNQSNNLSTTRGSATSLPTERQNTVPLGTLNPRVIDKEFAAVQASPDSAAISNDRRRAVVLKPANALLDRAPQTSSNTATSVSHLWLSAILLGCWLIGVLISATLVLSQFFQARRLYRTCLPLRDLRLIRIYKMLCARMKLSSAPQLRVTHRAETPLLIGTFRPVILMPASLLKELSDREIKLIFAHDLAHAKRHDLLWNSIAVIVRIGFFFHPLVWLAESRYALDQEMACDLMAIEATKSTTVEYGKLLVRCSSPSRRATRILATVGVMGSFNALKRRIVEMSRNEHKKPKSGALLSVVAIAFSLLLALPIDLVAQQNGDDQQNEPLQTSAINREAQDALVAQAAQQEEAKTEPDDLELVPFGAVQAAQPGAKLKSPSKVTAADNKSTKTPPGNGGITVGRNFASQSETSASGMQPQETKTGNVSVSVNSDGIRESIKVIWKRNGGVKVTFSSNRSGKNASNTYGLKSMQELKQVDPAAFQFYRKHVANEGATGLAGQASTFEQGAMADAFQGGLPGMAGAGGRSMGGANGSGMGRVSVNGIGNVSGSTGQLPGRTYDRSDEDPYARQVQPKISGMTSSAWSSASSSNVNGRRQSAQASGGSNEGKLSGPAADQLRQNLEAMIRRTEDPMQRQLLRRMLDQHQQQSNSQNQRQQNRQK